eukprot:CFRG5956T1
MSEKNTLLIVAASTACVAGLAILYCQDALPVPIQDALHNLFTTIGVEATKIEDNARKAFADAKAAAERTAESQAKSTENSIKNPKNANASSQTEKGKSYAEMTVNDGKHRASEAKNTSS